MLNRNCPPETAGPVHPARTISRAPSPRCGSPSVPSAIAIGLTAVRVAGSRAACSPDPGAAGRRLARRRRLRLNGTLGANIIVHPKTAHTLGPVLDEGIAALRPRDHPLG